MTSTTHIRRVVVSLLIIIGFTLVVFPMSVFSQEGTLSPTNINEGDNISSDSLANKSQTYGIKVEKLSGDGIIGDFVVGPGKVELSIEPGESKTIEMLVTNRMGETKTFQFSVEDIEGTKGGDRPVILLGDDRGPYTLKDYITFPEKEFTLEHMQRARIPVTVTLPADAESGGRYGSVIVQTVSRDADLDPQDGAQPSSAIISRIGTLFFVSSPGETDISGELIKFATLPPKTFFTGGPINFQILFENTGSIHLNPYGEMHVKNMFGEEVGFVELDPWFALPKSLRSRELEWARELLIGRYTATVQINRGYEDIVDTQSVTFWVIPLKLTSVVFVGLFLFFFLIRIFFKTFEFKRKVDSVE